MILCSYYCFALNKINTLKAVNHILCLPLYGLFGAEAHFYSVNTQRNCLSEAHSMLLAEPRGDALTRYW